MPGIGMGKFSTWQNSANQRSTTLVTNTVTNTDPCHGTGLSHGSNKGHHIILFMCVVFDSPHDFPHEDLLST